MCKIFHSVSPLHYVERQGLMYYPYFFGAMIYLLAFVNNGMKIVAQEKQKKIV